MLAALGVSRGYFRKLVGFLIGPRPGRPLAPLLRHPSQGRQGSTFVKRQRAFLGTCGTGWVKQSQESEQEEVTTDTNVTAGDCPSTSSSSLQPSYFTQ